jgi:hypothetical protein
MKKQAFNPYLPSWEYIPDGEPYVFDGRVYIYGSHDKFNGYVFCLGDYVCWSAPENDLSDWRYEGVIYKKTDDPLNPHGEMCLYAPDVTRGPDGKYYLYYVLDKVSVVSVAVCDTPAGKYEFYGYVHYKDGTRLGERLRCGARMGDEPQFDPGVLTEGEKTYLYTGFCGHGDKSRSGAWGMALGADMLTIVEEPVLVVPGNCYGKGTSFEDHEYFEAASIRKIGGTYYFIYSATPMHELCYATSTHPLKNFTYGGVIVSNCDLGISSYKPADKRVYPYGNNHGSVLQIENDFYIFYHRMTNDTWFSRQACIEKIFLENGKFAQVEMTSQGARGTPFNARGKFPAYIACNLFNDNESNATVAIGASGSSVLRAKPAKITQEGFTETADACYIADITDGTTIAFKYFACDNIKKITLTTRAYGRGCFEVRTHLSAEALGVIPIVSANIWTEFSAYVNVPDGVNAIYFTYKGGGTPHLLSFKLE